MSLVLQETSVQVKYWNHANLIKKQVKKVLFIKARQKSWQNHFYQELMLKLNRFLTQAISIENYEIKLFRSEYTHIFMYLCRVFFLTTLDIYKDYFKGHRVCIVWPDAKSGLLHYSLYKSYYVFMPRVLWPRSFLIFIIDKLKKFVANIFFKLVELVMYWDSCFIG